MENSEVSSQAHSWGNYLDNKRKKLSEQFDKSLIEEDGNNKNLFQGVRIYVNGYTNPSCDILKLLIGKFGGQYDTHQSGTVTHVVASNLCKSKIDRLEPNSAKVVAPQWILDSIRKGQRLPEDAYRLYHSPDGSIKPFIEHKFAVPKQNKLNTAGDFATKTAKDEDFIKDFYAKSRLHMISTWCQEMKDYLRLLQQQNDPEFPALREIIDYANKHPVCSKSTPYASPRECVMHLDLDCFFVSVGLLKRPELKGQPIAVTHSKGKRPADQQKFFSHAEIASCSYEARQMGVKNGMFLGQALKLCPNLRTMPYDFDEYRKISRIFYEISARFTLDIEAVSCDEMFLNLKKVLQHTQADPLDIATVIRQKISMKTGCPSSAGIGPNKLLARLATKKAKPNGQFYIEQANAEDFLSSLGVVDLPGVGRSMTARLKTLNIETCGQLCGLSIETLKSEFGTKIGQRLHDFARGIDRRPMFELSSKIHSSTLNRKSVSCDVNYGIRFTQVDEFSTFLRNLSAEISNRLKLANVKGRQITLKLMVRAQNAPLETKKFLGHGEVESLTRSVSIENATDDEVSISRHCLDLFLQLHLPVENLRGIGISIQKLISTTKPVLICDEENTSLRKFALNSSTSKCPENEHEKQAVRFGDAKMAEKTQTAPTFCGVTSYDDVKVLLSEWISESTEPDPEDSDIFLQYALNCVQQNRSYLAYNCLRFIHSLLMASSSLEPAWRSFYEFAVERIQLVFIEKYHYPLKLPRFV